MSFYDLFLNYRKQYEQRFVLHKILLLVPMFSVICLIATLNPLFTKMYLDFTKVFIKHF